MPSTMAINFNNVGSNPIRDQSRTDALTPNRSEERPSAKAPEARDDGDVRLSDSARRLKALGEDLARQDAVDRDRVEEIRLAIAEGRYHVDPVRLAEKFIEFEGTL